MSEKSIEEEQIPLTPEQDEALQHFNELLDRANAGSETLCADLTQKIVADDSYTIQEAMLTLSFALQHLSSYLYTSEEEMLQAIRHSRELVVNQVVPALLDPKPCGRCEQCKNGHEDHCLNPLIVPQNTQLRLLPLLCNSLLTYAMYNTTMMLAGTEKEDSDE